MVRSQKGCVLPKVKGLKFVLGCIFIAIAAASAAAAGHIDFVCSSSLQLLLLQRGCMLGKARPPLL